MFPHPFLSNSLSCIRMLHGRLNIQTVPRLRKQQTTKNDHDRQQKKFCAPDPFSQFESLL